MGTGPYTPTYVNCVYNYGFWYPGIKENGSIEIEAKLEKLRSTTVVLLYSIL
jgi:hypothetical protein